MLLNRESLLKKDDFKIEKVEFENGEFVFVKQMSGSERDAFEQSILKQKRSFVKGKEKIDFEVTREHFRAKLAVVTICDENGELLLRPEDYSVLSKNITADKLEKIVNAAQRLNAITEEDKEGLIKNSEGDQVANSNLDSVEN